MSLQVITPYSILNNAIEQSLKHIEDANYGLAKAALIKAQIDAEEQFLSADEFVFNQEEGVYVPKGTGESASNPGTDAGEIADSNTSEETGESVVDRPNELKAGDSID